MSLKNRDNKNPFTAGELQAVATTKQFKSATPIVLDANSEEAKTIWKCREDLLLAIQKSTPKVDEVDICVPINHIPDVLDRVDELEKRNRYENS